MIDLNKRCIDFLQNVVKAHDDITGNDKLSKDAAEAAYAKATVDSIRNPTLRESFASLVRNNYLSALSTTTKNLIGNLARLIELPIARLAGGIATLDAKKIREAGYILSGYSKAFQSVYPRFIGGWKNKTIEFDGRMDQRKFDFYLSMPGVDAKTLDTINQPLNYMVTRPQSLQRATDEAFSAMFERAQFEILKSKTIADLPDEFFARQGISRQEYANRLDDFAGMVDRGESLAKFLELRDPFAAKMLDEFARYGTFRTGIAGLERYSTKLNVYKASPIDQATKAMFELSSKIPELSLITPFIMTPTNIAKFGAGYVPGLGMMRWFKGRSDIKFLDRVRTEKKRKLDLALESKARGNNPDKTIAKLEKQIAELDAQIYFKQDLNKDFIGQQLLGVGLITTAFGMKSAGMLTGSMPDDPAKRQAFIDAKIPVNSVKIGDNWFSYAGIEPLHTVLALVSDSMDVARDVALNRGSTTEIASGVAGALKAAFLDKTFTESLSNLMIAMQDEKKAASTLVSLTNGLTPNLMNQIARLIDPVKREVKDDDLATWMINNLKSRVPGMRQELPAQMGLTGEERMVANRGAILTGFNVQEANQTNVQKVLTNPFLKLLRPSRTVYGVYLEPDQYERMTARMGQITDQLLTPLSNSAGFMALPPRLQAKFVQGMISQVRSDVRMQMLGEIVRDPVQKAKYLEAELLKRGLDPFTTDFDVD